MFVFIFFFILSSVTAPAPAHLKPGALVKYVDRLSLVEDVLWVRYPYAALQTIPSRLERVLEQMDSVLSQLEDAQVPRQIVGPDSCKIAAC